MQFKSTLSILSLVAFAAPALAGNPVPVPQWSEPMPPVVVPDWTGFYAGLTAMKAMGTFGNDDQGVPGFAFPSDGEGELDGSGYGLLLGWNGQSGDMVYGAELSWQKTDITGSENCPREDGTCSADIENVAALRARLGWLAGEDTLLYGTVGVSKAKMTASLDVPGGGNFSDEQMLTGYVFGLGLEQKVTDHISVRGALMRYDFNGEDYQLNGNTFSDVGADFNALELGLSYNF